MGRLTTTRNLNHHHPRWTRTRAGYRSHTRPLLGSSAQQTQELNLRTHLQYPMIGILSSWRIPPGRLCYNSRKQPSKHSRVHFSNLSTPKNKSMSHKYQGCWYRLLTILPPSPGNSNNSIVTIIISWTAVSYSQWYWMCHWPVSLNIKAR